MNSGAESCSRGVLATVKKFESAFSPFYKTFFTYFLCFLLDIRGVPCILETAQVPYSTRRYNEEDSEKGFYAC